MPPRSHPPSCSLPGAHIIEPATQGDYDGLCGVYCIINAIQIVLAPHRELRREEIRALFTAAISFLAQHGSLPEALASCVSERVWPKLAERMVAEAQAIVERAIRVERQRLSKDASVDEALYRIEGMIVAGKAPCVFLRGKYRHYSVISGYTPVSLKLFDSFGHHWVLRRACGTTSTQVSLHRLHVPSIVALAVL